MKYLLVLALVFSSMTFASAQDATEQIIITETMDASFGKTWAALKKAMDVAACGKAQQEKVIEPVEEGGLYKGVYVSDYCILVAGEDSSKSVMQEYGDVPPIRGGIWITGRVQYKVNVKEEENRKTKIILRAELSGFEEFITNQVYFFSSNGILEKRMMDAIVANVKEVLAAPAND
ncbi:MAG: hypothetical protein SGJ05_06730 [bacterium]|nr:hypothetical protein [bacterium]